MKTNLVKVEGAEFEFYRRNQHSATIKAKLETAKADAAPITVNLDYSRHWETKEEEVEVRLPHDFRATLDALGIEIEASGIVEEFKAIVRAKDKADEDAAMAMKTKQYNESKAHKLKAQAEALGIEAEVESYEHFAKFRYDGVDITFKKNGHTVKLDCLVEGRVRYSQYGDSTRKWTKMEKVMDFVQHKLACLEAAAKREADEAAKKKDAGEALRALVSGLKGVKAINTSSLDHYGSLKVYVTPEKNEAPQIAVGVLPAAPDMCYIEGLVLNFSQLQKLISVLNE